jgi:hypothetical protein
VALALLDILLEAEFPSVSPATSQV